ncbi:acyl-CoA dehydrogenase family protein [Escherichia coli]|nr:acyl-CoA dehydrogenase family protein [Escherichia coli]EHN6668832.1 acyl-CoA dehydrogenase family protein [Escherichia coli]EKM0555489.1 acyl-CoA dehydrogenase family protein [Escherichia coli]
MDFSLTEEQELLLASIRELITTNFPEEYFRTCDQNGTYPREFMRALADNGISMLGVPEEFGGIPADYVTQMLALMEVSKCGAPAFLITNGQCIHSMRRFGSAEQLRKTAEIEMERLINAARSTGFAECAFEDAARYANQRIAFGKPIGHNQMIQEKLALMAIKIDNMRNMVLKVAWQADQHQSLRTSAALAKLYCARTAMEVIDDAIQIMGGLGYTDEARVSRFWRDVRCERIGGGTD